jgi:hypothetical protein
MKVVNTSTNMYAALSSLCAGDVFVSVSTMDASKSGPFLVCYESHATPLINSGCPNGQVREFYVHLHDGARYNADAFGNGIMKINAELHIK